MPSSYPLNSRKRPTGPDHPRPQRWAMEGHRIRAGGRRHPGRCGGEHDTGRGGRGHEAHDPLVTRQWCLWQSVWAEPRGGATPVSMLVSAPPGAD